MRRIWLITTDHLEEELWFRDDEDFKVGMNYVALQVIIAALPDLCRSLFGKETFGALSPEEQQEMMRQIRFRFSADVNQIARVCGVSYSDAAKILDKV